MTEVDLSEFAKLAKPKKKQCAVGVAREGLDPEALAQLDAACAANSGVINAGAICAWLAARGHVASHPAVTAHRMGTCSCHVDG